MKRNPNKLNVETNEVQEIDLLKGGPKRKPSKSSVSTEDSPLSAGRSPTKKSTKISDRSPTKKSVDHLKQLDGIEKPYNEISESKLPHIVSIKYFHLFLQPDSEVQEFMIPEDLSEIERIKILLGKKN